MQMKNVLDRLTELAKDNPSPDVKQAMENTRRMSVVEDADVVEVHEGVAEGEENKYGSQENWDSLRKDIRSQFPYKKGTTVTVPHKGKLVNGKIVRYEAGGGGYSPAYVVDIGEYESIMVELNKVRQGLAEGYWADAVKASEKASKERAGKPFEKNPASHDKNGVYLGDKDLAGNPVPKHKETEVEEGKVYDPITKKMVAIKPIKVQAGGGATRNGVPFEPGPSKFKNKLPISKEVEEGVAEDVRGLYYGDKGIRPPQTQAERDQIAGDIKQARTTNRADQTTTGYGDRVAPQRGAASSATPGQIGAKTTNAAGQTAFSTRSADPKYANYAGNIKTAAGAGKGVAEGSLREISTNLLRQAATVAADKEDKLRKSRYQNHADYQLAVQKGENPDYNQAALRNKDLHAKRLRALDQTNKFTNAADLKSGNLKNHNLTYAKKRGEELKKGTLGKLRTGDYDKKASEIDKNAPWYNRPVWFPDNQQGVAEGSRKAYLKHNNLVDLEKPLTGLEDEFNKFLRTHDPAEKQKYQQGIKDRIKTRTMAGPKGVLPEQGMAEGHFSDQDVQKKDKQYAGTKAYHAKNKAGKEKTATDAKTAFDAKFGGGNPASALKIREQSMTEGVNFAEMHRTKHTTLDEMLNELHDDINTFKQCGQMSEQLRDFMEVHHYGKKQLMDAAYGPVDELADMTKLAGVQTPVTTAPAAVAPAAGPELAESSGEMINGKEVDMYSLEVGGVDYGDSPDFVDAYFEAGSFVDGTPLSDNELEQLTHERGDLVSELASEHMIGAGDDARDRQRDMDMEMEGVSDGDNGLASAHAQARRISGEHGVGQHVNCDPESGHHYCSDWYIDGETVGSYNMGKRYDDSGYIDEEEMMPGEESDVAQKAQGIEAVSGKKINQMNPGEIKMAGQKVDAMGVTESKQMVDECGMMGGSMQPNTPANINISASAASGGEVAAMINDLLKLAGRPENADAHMHEPGVVAIDGTMDAGGAEELAAMLGGEEEVVDETGDAGGFADATTQPDALVYDENPVLTQTGVQKHTLGGYHNGDSPLAATTELEESLWRKFQNQ